MALLKGTIFALFGILLEQVFELREVLHCYVQPKHITSCYYREELKALLNYPNREERRSTLRRVFHWCTLAQFVIFLVTQIFAITESLHSVVDTGEDLTWNFATFVLALKTLCIHLNADDIDKVIDALNSCHCKNLKNQRNMQIRNEIRFFYLAEIFLGFAWHAFVAVFLTIVLVQPQLTGKPLPFHAVFPYHWHDSVLHPNMHACIYVWQSWVFTYLFISVVPIELQSAHCFSQLALNFKILCIELRSFGKSCQDNTARFRFELRRLIKFHQHIIDIVKLHNKVFYAPLILQMASWLVMISMTTFAALAARHDPAVAARFVVFVLINFFHLTYWCVFGDLVRNHSQNVAQAAYEIYEWHKQPPGIQRDIMFIIQRAQKPLDIEASPFPPFTLTSCMAILKQSYTMLTVMLETLD